MKWAIWITGAVCVLSFLGHLPRGGVAASDAVAPEPQQALRVASLPKAKTCGATLREYMALQIGMFENDAERIIGCKGTELSRVSYGGSEMMMLSWRGETGLISNMNATFDSGRLTSKAQLGLE